MEEKIISVTVNQNWSADKTKNLQKMLNDYGFKDDNGNTLAEDGMIGPKTQQALTKMNTYQQHLTKPDASTAAWQEQLNDWGYKDMNGDPLKVDGIYGPKTDAANNEFENGFFDGFTGGTNPKKTIPTQTYPPMPKASDSQILAAVTPDYNTTGYEWQQSHAVRDTNAYIPLSNGAASNLAQQQTAKTNQPYVYPYYLDYATEAGVKNGSSMSGLMRSGCRPRI